MVELLIVVVIIGIVASIAVPNFLASRRAANEASAISGLRSIFSAEHTFASSNSGSFGTINQLYTAGYIDATIGAGSSTKSGYRYSIIYAPADPRKFTAQVEPTVHILSSPILATGDRTLAICEAGVLYQTAENALITFDPATREPNASPVAVPVQR